MSTEFRYLRKELENGVLRDLKRSRNTEESLLKLQELYYTESEELFLILLIFHLSSGLERIAEMIRTGAVKDAVFDEHLAHVRSIMEELGQINASEKADEERTRALIRRFEEKRVLNSTQVLQVSEAGDFISGYEYVLNRREAEFVSSSLPAGYEDEAYVKKLFAYLTSPSGTSETTTKEERSAVIMERLLEVMEQLPFRMTKKRFFSMIEDDFSVYENGEKRTFKELLESLNMSVFLKDLPKARESFPEIDGYIRQFEETDLSALDEKTFFVLKNNIDASADYLNGMLDLLMSWQEIMNAALGYLEARMMNEKQGFITGDTATMTAAREILYRLCKMAKILPEKLPEEVKDRVFVADDIDAAIAELYESFESLEGVIENLTECEQFLVAHLEEYAVSFRTEIEGNEVLRSLFGVFRIMKLLQSNSDFVETGDYRDAAEGLLPGLERTPELISPEEIREAFAEFQTNMTGLLEELPKPLRRYRMVKTLSLLRIIPHDFEEIRTYVTDSLTGCTDESEKIAVIEILNNMMDLNN